MFQRLDEPLIRLMVSSQDRSQEFDTPLQLIWGQRKALHFALREVWDEERVETMAALQQNAGEPTRHLLLFYCYLNKGEI